MVRQGFIEDREAMRVRRWRACQVDDQKQKRTGSVQRMEDIPWLIRSRDRTKAEVRQERSEGA